uniref:Uncharacterized protein n=1 Tax=Oryzias latipes TaxID=8090 RepID=A0A3P9KBX0_ORYLA
MTGQRSSRHIFLPLCSLLASATTGICAAESRRSADRETEIRMALRTLVAACVLLSGVRFLTTAQPPEISNSFCKMFWLLGVPCDQVNVALVSGLKGKQSYKLGPVTPAQILANHTSAVGQVEYLNFTLAPTAMTMGCHVAGSSVSSLSFSLFDNGTNYCNLYKVLKGSGLTKTPGFMEFSNEWLCLGYGVSVCK